MAKEEESRRVTGASWPERWMVACAEGTASEVAAGTWAAGRTVEASVAAFAGAFAEPGNRRASEGVGEWGQSAVALAGER